MPIFHMSQLCGGYGEVELLQDIDIQVMEGEICTIIGPNGAGKSTTLKAAAGILPKRTGSIKFKNHELINLSTVEIVKTGIGYVPQVDNVFREMSVHENLELGSYLRGGDLAASYDRVYSLFPPLTEKRNALAGSLSGGQRQMVAMGRALMLDPSMLLLDEPTAGLSPKYCEEIFQLILNLKKENITILLVEQHAKRALEISDRGYALVTGKNRATGTGRQLLNDPMIAQMFLGG